MQVLLPNYEENALEGFTYFNKKTIGNDKLIKI